MRELTVRISDDLHAKLQKLAGPARMSNFVREAIAEKAGRAELTDRIIKLEERVEQLERQQRSRS